MASQQNVRIATWNATGIMSSSSYLSDFLNNTGVDFCGLSEHWLFRHNLHVLNSINNKYTYYAMSDPDLDYISNRKVGKGGLCIMWKKSLSSRVSTLTLNCNSIIGVQFMYSPGCYYYIFQVYMPCKNHPIREYKRSLAEIENTLIYIVIVVEVILY